MCTYCKKMSSARPNPEITFQITGRVLVRNIDIFETLKVLTISLHRICKRRQGGIFKGFESSNKPRLEYCVLYVPPAPNQLGTLLNKNTHVFCIVFAFFNKFRRDIN